MKRFEYSPLSKKLKAQTDIVKKHYQKLDNTNEFVGIKKEEPTLKKYNISSLIFNIKHRFCEYYNNKLFNSSSSLESKYLFLLSFYSDLNKFNNLNPQKKSQKKEK